MKIDDAIIKKAMEMNSKEELYAFVKEQGMEVLDKEIDTIWDRMHPGNMELSDDELDNVNGGCGSSINSSNPKCPSCHGSLSCYMSNSYAKYDMYQCTKCGKEYKHIWEGDVWI